MANAVVSRVTSVPAPPIEYAAFANAALPPNCPYRRNRRTTKCKKCKCYIIITGGGVRRHSRFCKHKCCNKKVRKTKRGGSMFANAAYSVAGSGTEVGPSTTALANPAPYTAYNSCHTVQ